MTVTWGDYAEDRAALRPAAVVLGVGMPVILVAATVIGAVFIQEAFLVPAAVALAVWLATGTMRIFVHWPTGIRIDQEGVRIGNVRHPDANQRRPSAPSLQAYRVFEVEWQGVESMRVVRDRDELRRLTRRSRRAPTSGIRARGGTAVGFYLGMLTPPLSRAALVLDVDEWYATFPEFRTHQALAVATSQIGTRSTVWVAPTRRPDRLAEVVTAITGSPEWADGRSG